MKNGSHDPFLLCASGFNSHYLDPMFNEIGLVVVVLLNLQTAATSDINKVS